MRRLLFLRLDDWRDPVGRWGRNLGHTTSANQHEDHEGDYGGENPPTSSSRLGRIFGKKPDEGGVSEPPAIR